MELRENALSNLPPSFENLRNLERLDLGDNELTDLPSFIGQLTKLSELWLDHNLLSQLPKVIILSSFLFHDVEGCNKRYKILLLICRYIYVVHRR